MKRYKKGFHYKEKGASYKSYAIDDLREDWGEKIVVHGDIKLRDLIIKLLNKYETDQFNKLVKEVNEY